jgi:dTDP-4-dehydrorhamnose reductase
MEKKRIVITGGNGQLGRSFSKLGSVFENLELLPIDINELDISKTDDVDRIIPDLRPDFLINCAAYTAVDAAEENQDSAFKVNYSGPKNLSSICKVLNIPLIHISTDYVFPGDSEKPYQENDPTGPVTVYGRSKLAGEEAIIQSGVLGMIIRTSWLYSEFGHNFVKSMIRLGGEKEELSVVSDQLGSPTFAGDLANSILLILTKISDGIIEPKPSGIYHFGNAGVCSWYDLANAVMEISEIKCKIKPVSTEEFPLPAKRPAYSVLDTSKIRNEFNLEISQWRTSLIKCLEQLKV